jgi:hypothetical protein
MREHLGAVIQDKLLKGLALSLIECAAVCNPQRVLLAVDGGTVLGVFEIDARQVVFHPGPQIYDSDEAVDGLHGDLGTIDEAVGRAEVTHDIRHCPDLEAQLVRRDAGGTLVIVVIDVALTATLTAAHSAVVKGYLVGGEKGNVVAGVAVEEGCIQLVNAGVVR